jgi:hypothetical protein
MEEGCRGTWNTCDEGASEGSTGERSARSPGAGENGFESPLTTVLADVNELEVSVMSSGSSSSPAWTTAAH